MIFQKGDEVRILKGADAGKVATVEGREDNFLIIKLPSGKTRRINPRHVR